MKVASWGASLGGVNTPANVGINHRTIDLCRLSPGHNVGKSLRSWAVNYITSNLSWQGFFLN